MQAINFSRMLKPVNIKVIEEKKLILPKNISSKFNIKKTVCLFYFLDRKTLVFDLDETLIHC